jgi:hypothetical protein
MPVNSQSIGKDVSLDIYTSRGPLNVPAAAITNFTSQPQTTSTASKGLDGVTRNAVFPDGWQGTFEIDRLNDSIDAWWAQYEADYYAGVNLTGGTITETIAEPNGSVSQYRYTGVVLNFTNAGSRQGNQLIKQTLSFMASRRLKVS